MKINKLVGLLEAEAKAKTLWNSMAVKEKAAFAAIFPSAMFVEESDISPSDLWWDRLSHDEQKDYVRAHPKSKFANKIKFDPGHRPVKPTGPQIPQQPKAEAPPEKKSSPRAALVAAPANPEHWPEHIRALKLPPAWTDVQINMDPHADLQAIGFDQKKRSQYVYSEKFAKSQAALKFARIHEMMQEVPEIHKQISLAQNSQDPIVKDHGDCSRLVFEMGVRPGSDDDTGAETKAYGASTLEGRHVVTEDGKTYLRFVGKKGISLNLPVHNPDLGDMLRKRAQNAGPDGKLFGHVTNTSLSTYTHSLGKGGYKTKDMRTLKGTSEAYELVKQLPAPRNEKEYKKSVRAVAIHVSKILGNTPAICLSAYISPTVFGKWQNAAGGSPDDGGGKEEASADDRYLRTAVKTNKGIYAGHQGQNHYHLKDSLNIPEHEGEHGFLNHKNQFLPGEVKHGQAPAAKYAIDNGLQYPNVIRAGYQPNFLTTDDVVPRQFPDIKHIKTREQASLEVAADAFLRTAIKHEGKTYVGHQGEFHDLLGKRHGFERSFGGFKKDGKPTQINIGFVNHKGHFLDRNKAYDYAEQHGLMEKPEYVFGKSENKQLPAEALNYKEFPKDKVLHTETAAQGQDWWDTLSRNEQLEYVHNHPHTHRKVTKLRVGNNAQLRPGGALRHKVDKPLPQSSDAPKKIAHKDPGHIKITYGGHGIDPNKDKRFKLALKNTPGVEVTDDGIKMQVFRYQKPEQAGKKSVRTGVFFIPDVRNSKDYRAPEKSEYGGPQEIEGNTTIKTPLVVMGSHGGDVPEDAYTQLVGHDRALEFFRKTEELRNGRVTRSDIPVVSNILSEYGGDSNLAKYIVANSPTSHQLISALNEHILAQEARRQGYDSILGINVWSGSFSELFHLKQTRYPKPGEALASIPSIKEWTRWKFKQAKREEPASFSKHMEQASSDDRYLRTAIKTDKGIYAGHQGELHSLLEKRSGATSKADGFLNHKHQFLDRQAAVKYAADNGMMPKKHSKLISSQGGMISDVLPDRRFKDTVIHTASEFYQ